MPTRICTVEVWRLCGAAALGVLAGGLPAAAAALADPATTAVAADESAAEAARKAHAATRDLERRAIVQERTRLQERQAAAQAGCYQRFAVEDCLRRARTEFREGDAALRARELELNDAERKDKAAAREALIEQRRRESPPATASAPQ